MNKKKSKNIPTMAKQTAMIIAAVMFVLGFLAGVVFTAFKTNSASDVASNSTTGINYAQKAKDFENEVINNPQNTEAWIQLGNVYFDTDKYDQVRPSY
jgi:cytochrome c-type biogenesis protein CcmH/NrfG